MKDTIWGVHSDPQAGLWISTQWKIEGAWAKARSATERQLNDLAASYRHLPVHMASMFGYGGIACFGSSQSPMDVD